MKIKLTMMSLLVVTGLAACTPSVEDLVENPELLQETIDECMKMSRDDVNSDEACKNAQIAYQRKLTGSVNNVLKGLMGK